MNRSVKIWFCIGLSALLTTACDDRLDVQPTQSIEASQALNTEQDVIITLTGAYDGLSDINLYGGGIQYTSELLGNNRDVVFAGTFSTLNELSQRAVTTSNTVVRDFWLDGYNAINRANNVLSALDKVGEANRGNIEGQARFIRGAIYFELVRAFAKDWGDGTPGQNPGVPLVLEPTDAISDDDYRARNTVAEVYTQVLADLTQAETLLPEEQENGTAFATKGAAQALLARVYLQQRNYAQARDAANRVITSGTYALGATFAEVFTDGTAGNLSEVIFRIAISEQDGVNDLNTFFASSLNQGRGDIRLQQAFLQLYETADVRGQFINRATINTFTSKFNDQFGDVPVVRLAEMYLIRAEANFRLNTTIGATPLEDINRIRNRAKATPLTQAQLTLDAILRERRLELAFEGNLLPDVKRTGASIGTTPATANNLVLPIPQREIDTNKELVQNPGY
ncbi:RagB/SusD family nutrient uptake outer membrane protein [Larkinella sp. VNQ87]|uniref:RagB/SusD family nutrient uptake outer membrane protein n=1 Tax=Larkinella sp. VNQ87 TaxID=3400921 RepID=UPI003C008E0A